MASNYSTSVLSRRTTIVVAGTAYVLANRRNILTLRNTTTNHIITFTSLSACEWHVRRLIEAGNRVTLRNRLILWIAALIASIEIPTPTTPASNTKCAGFQNRHFNLPRELQNTPATHFALGKSVCVHCYAAFEKSMAAYERVNEKPAPALVYTALPHAA